MQKNTVAYDEGHDVQLEKKLFLEDAISDLPPVCLIYCVAFRFICSSISLCFTKYIQVGNYESRDEMRYDKDAQTDFQRLIRLSQSGET